MGEMIGFDALTAIVTRHYLEERHLPQGLVAWLMMEAATRSAETVLNKVRVTIKGWSGKGEPVVIGGDSGVYSMKVTLPATSKVDVVTYAGRLSRHERRLSFRTEEMAFGTGARLVANRGRALHLEIRQQLPETVLIGMESLIGRPLSVLAAHPALARPEGDRIRIAKIGQMTVGTRSAIRTPGTSGPGIDVEIDAPIVEIPISR